jgi:putative DNA primase/helicase
MIRKEKDYTLVRALEYAEHGWKVFPVHTARPDGTCSCNKTECNRIGKHPRYDSEDLREGLRDATTDRQLIRRWWSRWANANIGIVTGKISGIVVLDVDLDKGGNKSLDGLEVDIIISSIRVKQ